MARKRKDGKRVNGRLSQASGDKQARRSLEQQDVMSVAREARERVLGVPARESGTELAGWYVGRLRIAGVLEAHQYRAAIDFAMDYERYRHVMGLPKPPRAVDLNSVHGLGFVPEDPERTHKAIDRWDDAKRALTEAEVIRRDTIYAAVYHCVLMDTEMPHFLPLLDVGLDILAKHYRIEPVLDRAA